MMRRRSRYDEKKKMHRTKKEKKYSKMIGNQNVHITASPHTPSLLSFTSGLRLPTCNVWIRAWVPTCSYEALSCCKCRVRGGFLWGKEWAAASSALNPWVSNIDASRKRKRASLGPCGDPLFPSWRHSSAYSRIRWDWRGSTPACKSWRCCGRKWTSWGVGEE